MKVAFAGTPEFAACALQAVLEAGFDVPVVLTQPDRPAGRGLKLVAGPVKRLAQQHGLPIAQPRSLRLDGKYPQEAQAGREALAAAAPDVMVVAAYGLILPTWVLQAPTLGCLNIHASLLPRWRGAAPIQRAIEAGDAQTGITIMQMDEGLDTGPMITVHPTPIGPEDTSATLFDRLARIGAEAIVQTLQSAGPSGWPAQPQPESGVTHARKIEKQEATIDWHLPAAAIERRIRAFDPFPGASFPWRGETVKVWRARVRAESSAEPGRIVACDGAALSVACAEGTLDLLELQRPGGRRQPAAAWMAAQPALLGERLASTA